MSGDFPFPAKTVSPVKCNEKPWDVWVGEIGYRSPRREEEARAERRRRGGLSRLRHDAMPLHGLLPQMDTLDAAVCHLCGCVVKCSAAYRHLLEAHSGGEPLLPPPAAPAPAAKPKAAPSRSRHKKEPPPPPPDPLPKMETSPLPPPAPPDLHYPDDAGAACALAGDLQVSVDSGDLPVVSIQVPEDLPLGENLTDEILEIMNSEGIQSADDITNAEDWNNIIKDIGNMQEINFPSVPDPVSVVDPYGPMDATMAVYAPAEPEPAALRYAPGASPARPAPPDPGALAVQPPKPATPSTKASKKGSKPKFNLREYDPNKHCGVVTVEIPKPCTRSLTCKAHALSLRRAVEGRAKPFDALLAEHRAAREAAHAPPPPAEPGAPDAGDEPRAERGCGELADEPLAEEAAPEPPGLAAPSQPPQEEEAEAEGDGVCWYAAVPRPLALCTYNASHAGGAVALGKRYATVRGNVKASLARPGKAAAGGGAGGAGAARGAGRRPELRRLVVACGPCGARDVQRTLSELLGAEARLNGHAPRLKPPPAAKRPAALDLGFSLDPLLADEKC